jgi:hypothetical protein
MNQFTCPICKNLHESLPRYNKAVCFDCLNNFVICDVNGNVIKFENIDDAGGIKSITTLQNGNEIIGNEEFCYINGHKCNVDESRFGGIVISCFVNTYKRLKK